MQDRLLPEETVPARATADRPARRPTRPEEARVHRAERSQVEFFARPLDAILPLDHPARAVWKLVAQLDLTAFYAPIESFPDGPGRPASDPRVLLALWVYANTQGVGSARALDRLCHEHDVYRWLRGGVPVNYHLLADFRVAHGHALDDLLTQTIAALLEHELITRVTVAQDGVRVRASAGASSFHRRKTLERHLAEAEAQVARLAEEREHPDPGVRTREQAAQERAAQDRTDRVKQALAELPKLEAIKEKQRQNTAKDKQDRVAEARVSSTDPEARVMKMANGGFNPAFNIQLVTDGESRAILGVEVTNQGSDQGLTAPMEAQVTERTGRHPTNYLVDQNLASHDDITTLTERGVTIYAPVPEPRGATPTRAATDPRPGDSDEVKAFRARMATEEGQDRLKARSSIAEWANAQCRHRYGLQLLPVRGIAKVTSLMLLMAVSHNLLRILALTN